MSKPDDQRRAPRAFNLDKEVLQPVAKTVGDAEKEKSAPKSQARRKPKTASEKAVLRVLPDEAAQRFDAQDLSDDALLEQLTPPPPVVRRKPFGWSKLFWSAFFGLASLAAGLWIDQLIRDLFDRQDWLGWLAVGLTCLFALATMALVLREFLGMRCMARIETLRQQAAEAVAQDDMKAAKITVQSLITLYTARPDTAEGRGKLAIHSEAIIDGADLIALAERDLLRPLDQKARSLVMGSAKRVSVVTAVSPRAIVDIGFVLFENMRLMRRIAELYGGRPGSLGFWRLARNILGHLAVTGSIAVGDGLLQQVVGQGLAARISSRLGEGVVNGLLTARIGIAAMDVCRPLEFSDQARPSAGDFLGELTRTSPKGHE